MFFDGIFGGLWSGLSQRLELEVVAEICSVFLRSQVVNFFILKLTKRILAILSAVPESTDPPDTGSGCSCGHLGGRPGMTGIERTRSWRGTFEQNFGHAKCNFCINETLLGWVGNVS